MGILLSSLSESRFCADAVCKVSVYPTNAASRICLRAIMLRYSTNIERVHLMLLVHLCCCPQLKRWDYCMAARFHIFKHLYLQSKLYCGGSAPFSTSLLIFIFTHHAKSSNRRPR